MARLMSQGATYCSSGGADVLQSSGGNVVFRGGRCFDLRRCNIVFNGGGGADVSGCKVLFRGGGGADVLSWCRCNIVFRGGGGDDVL